MNIINFYFLILITSIITVIYPVENVKATEEIFYPTDDTVIRNYYNEPVGNSEYLYVNDGYDLTGPPIRCINDTLIKFDLSLLPNNVQIVSAYLKLYYSEGHAPDKPLYLYRINSFWDEDTVIWSNQPSYANQPTTYSFVPASYGWISFDVTSDVQSFAEGFFTNYGWKITNETGSGEYGYEHLFFCSKENGSYTPYLEIEMEANNPPNTPNKPSGPVAGWVNTYIQFSTNATDPDKIR